MTTKVDQDTVVALDYTLFDAAGDVLNSSAESEPIEFLQGYGEIVPGLEKALYGMAVGDEKEVVLEPDEAYGARQEDALETVPRSIFPKDFELEEGVPVQLRDDEDEVVTAYVSEIGEEEVVLDMNHPLAGERLRFQVKVVGLRQPSQEELEHGHVHSHGGHGH